MVDHAAHVGQPQAVLGQGVLARIREMPAHADVALRHELGADGIGQPVGLVAAHQVRHDQKAVVAEAGDLRRAQDSHVNTTLPVAPESNTRNASSAWSIVYRCVISSSSGMSRCSTWSTISSNWPRL